MNSLRYVAKALALGVMVIVAIQDGIRFLTTVSDLF